MSSKSLTLLPPAFCLVAALVLLPGRSAAHAGPVTYCKDVAPILYAKCVSCHRPGEVAPFPLVSYSDAAKRARQLAAVTSARLMPPWRPEPGFGDFRGSGRLSDGEINLIRQWAEDGALEGDRREMPALPAFTEGWQMGEPDIVLRMPQQFTIRAEGPDLFQCFVIPIDITTDKYVSGFEVRPGNRRAVHHALMFLDTTGTARRKDSEDPDVGYGSFGDPGFLPTGALGAWAPGVSPFRLPEGVGTIIKRGSDLVMQIHYHPTGKVERDQSSVGIYFSKLPPKKIAVSIPILQHNLDIPPGVKRHRVTTTFIIPADLEAIGITPHLHLLGQEMKVTASLPDGRDAQMIWIRDWNFNWQGQYQYATPLALPRGTRINMEAFYDNSSDNPRNPNDPPERVGWGPDSTDEMALCMILVAVDRLSNLALLRDAILKQPGFARNSQTH